MARKTKMNNITTPELLSQVSTENKELLADFLDYLRSVQRSEATIAGYENDIQIAWIWNLLHNNNIPYVNWTKRQVVRYQNWLLNENGNSPARIKRLKASLSSLANYIENVLDEDYPNFRNIINKVESPVNQPVREKTVFTEEQINTLLDNLTIKKHYDKACAVALALYSGRRKSEILRFKVDDFSDDVFHNARLTFDIQNIDIKRKAQFINGHPIVNMSIKLYVKLLEAKEEDLEIKENIDIKNISKEAIDALESKVKLSISDAINILRENKCDILKVYTLLNNSHPNETKKFMSRLEDEQDFLNHVVFKVSPQIYSV